jgi:hypothetical protein
VGLAWDGARFWAADRGENESWIYYSSDPKHETWVKARKWTGGRLGSITWGDGGVWVVDEDRGKVLLVDPMSPDSGPTKQVTIPSGALRRPPAITGVAWDGSTLWLVTGCGLCSGFFQLEPAADRLLQNFFPRCEPRGLAYYGGVLWTIAYNGPDHRPRVSVRHRTEDPLAVRWSHQLLPFHPDVMPLQYPKNPTAITFALGRLWVVDQTGLGSVFPFSVK